MLKTVHQFMLYYVKLASPCPLKRSKKNTYAYITFCLKEKVGLICQVLYCVSNKGYMGIDPSVQYEHNVFQEYSAIYYFMFNTQIF